jgi:hypothetical protein
MCHDFRISIGWMGGEGLGISPKLTSSRTLWVNFHHFLKHRSCFDVFSEPNVLEIGVKSMKG